tara:strand:- start:294 stop:482 length:189 start_codon:yes stop_codon:yes gene_type:complete
MRKQRKERREKAQGKDVMKRTYDGVEGASCKLLFSAPECEIDWDRLVMASHDFYSTSGVENE